MTKHIDYFISPNSGAEPVLTYLQQGIAAHDFPRHWRVSGHRHSGPRVGPDGEEHNPLSAADSAIDSARASSERSVELTVSRVMYRVFGLLTKMDQHELEIRVAEPGAMPPGESAGTVIAWRIEWSFNYHEELMNYLSGVRAELLKQKKRTPVLVQLLGYEHNMLASQEMMRRARTARSGVMLSALEPQEMRQAVVDVMLCCRPLKDFVAALRALKFDVQFALGSLPGMIDGVVNLAPKPSDGRRDFEVEPFHYALYDPRNHFGRRDASGAQEYDGRGWHPVGIADPFLAICFGVQHRCFVEADDALALVRA